MGKFIFLLNSNLTPSLEVDFSHERDNVPVNYACIHTKCQRLNYYERYNLFGQIVYFMAPHDTHAHLHKISHGNVILHKELVTKPNNF